jgi:rhamnogalacturonan endolyase
MKKESLHHYLCSLFFITAALFVSITLYAQGYTGYDYVEDFNSLPTMKGTIAGPNYLKADWLDAPTNTNGALQTTLTNQSGPRNATFTLPSPPAAFAKKLIVEFDWYPVTYTGGSGDEGQISFRNGTNVVFTVYNLRGSNDPGIAVGPLGTNTKAEAVNPLYRTSLTGMTLSQWYHFKVEIYAGERMAFTVTGAGGYERKVMLPVPSGFNQNQITNIYFNASRNGSNITWNTMLDNIGIRVADADPTVPATGVTVETQWETIDANNGTATLTASIEPFDVSSHAITWSVDNALASVMSGNPAWTATLTGLSAGEGDVTVTATSTATASILGTKVIHLSATGIPLTNVTISGATTVSANSTITLTTTVAPGNASNQNVVWSSSDNAIATVSTSGVVTGVGAGMATITATAADGNGAFDTHDVTVLFTNVTSVDLRGARRVFYSATPTSVAPFNLTSVVLPADASNPTLSWSSLDPSIATVNTSGQVTLAGGFGTTAIKAETNDGSGVVGYYYIEVAASNPYDQFSDFESNASPFTGNRSSFHNTQTIYFNGSGAGNRGQLWSLSSTISGGIINLKFDWWAGLVTTNENTGVLSIQDAQGTPVKILSIIYANTSLTDHFRYLTGDYNPSGDDPPQGIAIENITELDRWYTLDVTIDFHANECAFTITDRDNPSVTRTIDNIPLSPVYPPQPNVGSLYINGLRAATKNINITSAIDNFRYKVVDATLPTYAVTGLSLNGLDQVAPGGKMILAYPKIQPGNALNKNVTWNSSDPSVATIAVDGHGRAVITSVSEGTTLITVRSVENSSIYAEKEITVAPITLPERKMEQLDRGLVAVKSGGDVFLSWRLFHTDPSDVTFNIYKNDNATPLNATPLDAAHTDYLESGASGNDTYSVAVFYSGTEVYRSEPVAVWQQQYRSIPVEMPTTGHLPNGSAYTNYTIYDGSAADLDGDGQYEIIFLWAPANLQDNSNGGTTGNVFIDAYKLDGTKLWGSGKYIDLGSNIRAGAHYNPFLVFDFDGNGKAEIIVKTADGTKDTQGTQIGTNTVYANADGFVLSGPEYLSVFEGATGKLLATEPYDPPRGDVQAWGDGQGNRADRFLAAVAYLDGISPSAVMCRGYYTRTTLCAWNWDGSNLIKKWLFDTDNLGDVGKIYKGQGNHNMSVADVDDDGKDEIIYGSLTIDDDGQAMYTTGYGHGDAMHVGKLDPSRPGLQIMSVHEGPFPYGLEMHDLLTGDLIWGAVASADIGRGVTADIDPNFEGAESWSSGGLGTWSAQGVKLGSSVNSMNMAVYWDGDTGRELFDGGSNPSVTKINPTGNVPSKAFGSSSVITFSGASTNGGTKNNPCLQADILGDWREEMILRASDNTALRIYTTTTPTSHTGVGAVPTSGIPTLMHNKEYRLAVAWQNSGYNQPPHTDVFIGYNMAGVDRPADGVDFTVTLDPAGGIFSDDQSTTSRVVNTVTGTHIALPEVTKTGGFYSVGWMFADGTLYDPTAVYRGDLLLKVRWNKYRITFANEGAETYEDVVYASTATPSVPVRAGYNFLGWYNGNTLWDFNTPITDDVVLTARWVILYHVTFVSEDQVIDDQQIPENSRASSFIPVRAGHTFLGWYDGNTSWDFNTPIAGDVVLTAKWSAILYSVTFVSEGQLFNYQEVYYGQMAMMPRDPMREGYTFLGWHNGNIMWDFRAPVTDNVTLTAEWGINWYRVWFVSEDVMINYQDVFYGEKAVMPEDPVREGYNFLGWSYNGRLWNFNNDVVPATNITLIAMWEDDGTENVVLEEIRLYPNPVVNRLSVSGLEGGEQISFTDAAGRQCLTYQAESGMVNISVNSLPNGIYFVRITKGNDLIKTAKIIISKR